MLKKIALAVGGLFALVIVSTFAVAQSQIPYVASLGQNDIQQVIKNANPQAGNTYATLNQLRAWLFGGSSAQSVVPVLSSCGTSPSIATGSTGFAGRVTTGTGTPTGCVITFATAYTSTPACAVVSQTAPATTTPAYTVSTTAITIVQAAGDSRIYNYVCAALTGG
jgi:hypothetical protein